MGIILLVLAYTAKEVQEKRSFNFRMMLWNMWHQDNNDEVLTISEKSMATSMRRFQNGWMMLHAS
jgi:hypothetical protein